MATLWRSVKENVEIVFFILYLTAVLQFVLVVSE
jgi:hypothetical protein